MLKRRLIPKLQMKRSSIGKTPKMVLVTTIRFGETMEIGEPVSQAKIYQAQAADELIFLDLDATTGNRDIVIDVVRQAALEVFMPFCVGGGVRSLNDFRVLLANGADKVSINTVAVENPGLINEASAMFGSQCVVLSVDFKADGNGRYSVWHHGGKVKTDLDPVQWAMEAERRGAGELLLTSIDRDGTRKGLDLELAKELADRVAIPIILSGGCGLAEHFVEGFIKGRADAVSAGTYFCFKDENPMQTRAQIQNAGIPIRLHT
jgi:cyclase